ncbi:MAG TPA: RHS repeat-associated core domain-containing protein [Sedimentisphaerales bacterium]|nr:RHS repeat-associated core domain-containing protein [Sedimentisphaerales bacterium]
MTTTQLVDLYGHSGWALQNRLWRVTTDDTGATDAVVEYTYNEAGIKVKAFSYDTPDGGETKQNEVTKIFLIDSYNHTGYAQVLEEWSPSGSHPDVTYTIGDDVVSQSDSVGVRHLLYDGQGSTRQLVDNNEDVKDAYSYDGYGVMLTGNPTSASPAATSLLYTGEYFDTDMQQYYLRARWYDQQTGRFNRMDPFGGNNHDPLSWDYSGQQGTGCPSKKNLDYHRIFF